MNSLQKQLDDDMVAQLKYIASKQHQDGLPPTKRQKGSGGGSRKGAPGKGATAESKEVGDPKLAQRIQQNMDEIIMISEEKMKRAQQIYDLVDQHIRKLDEDLKSFGAEVSKERERLGVQPQVPQANIPSDSNQAKLAANAPSAVVPDELKTPDELYRDALAVADPNEPKYCYCNRISFGEMIACENDDCPIEWFHFSCVGFTPENRPKGQWFCDQCKQAAPKN